MSAIGDYIYYTYFCYQKGYAAPGSPNRNFTKAFNAYKVFNDKIRDIDKQFQSLGDSKTAYEIQQTLNMYTGSKADSSKRLELQKYLKDNLEQQLKHSPPVIDLSQMTMDAPVTQLLNKKYQGALYNFKRGVMTRDEFINNLKLLLKVVEENKELVASVMTGKTPLESLENRITILKKILRMVSESVKKNDDLFVNTYPNLKKNTAEYKALQQLDKLFNGGKTTIKGFHTEHTKGSDLLHQIRHLLNTIVLTPFSAKGFNTEFVWFDIFMMIGSIGGKRIVKTCSDVIGNKSSQTAFKANVVIDANEFLTQNTSYKFLNDDASSGYIVTNQPLAEKTDITFVVEDMSGKYQNIDVSVKNTSKPIFYFTSQSSLWNMIANENYNDFVNHYINVVAPKVNSTQNFLAYPSEKIKDPSIGHTYTADWGKIVKETGNRYELAEKAMNRLVVAKAVAGYNITKVNSSTKQIETMKIPNYLSVFDGERNIYEWRVIAMSDLYNNFIKTDSNDIIISKNGNNGKNTVNPFPDSVQEMMGDSYMDGQRTQEEAVIQRRIARSLSYIHNRKLDVYMKTASLNK